MASRGFFGIVVNGEEKISYIHDWSLPRGMGDRILAWLRTELGADTYALRRKADAIRVVNDSDVPTAQDIAALAPWTDLSVSSCSTDEWYCLLRRTQGNPAAILASGVILAAPQVPLDSLWTDWGYIIDFDNSQFEVYKGSQRTPHNKGRFASRFTPPDDYAPCALVASWTLDALPSNQDFLKAVRPSRAKAKPKAAVS